MANSRKVELVVEGMDCFSCVDPIKKALQDVEGVRSAMVMYMSKSATVMADNSVKTDALVAAVNSTGKTAYAKKCEVHLRVDGMDSTECADSVKEALEDVGGVMGCEVNLESKLATVTMRGNVARDDLIKAVKDNTGKGARVVEAE